MGLRYLRGLIYFCAGMVSSTRQELGGETSANTRLKALTSLLVVHHQLRDELQWGLPHVFRGPNTSEVLK